jgi:hypothetical protein
MVLNTIHFMGLFAVVLLPLAVVLSLVPPIDAGFITPGLDSIMRYMLLFGVTMILAAMMIKYRIKHENQGNLFVKQ